MWLLLRHLFRPLLSYDQYTDISTLCNFIIIYMPKPTQPEIAKHLDTIARTPELLKVMSAGFSDAQLATAPDDTSWSPLQILAHLRACADLWSYSIFAMLAESSPSLALIDARRWAKMLLVNPLPFHEALHLFTVKRGELVQVLQCLKFEDWSRSASIGDRDHTVYSQVRRMALHEASHMAQFSTSIAGKV